MVAKLKAAAVVVCKLGKAVNAFARFLTDISTL